MKTRQELFDKAVGGMIEQGSYSVDSRGQCLYRLPTESGMKKCIFGQIISDEMAEELSYNPSVSAIKLEALVKIFGPYYDQSEVNFWDAMQNIHDSHTYSHCLTNQYDYSNPKPFDVFMCKLHDFCIRQGLEWNFGTEVLTPEYWSNRQCVKK